MSRRPSLVLMSIAVLCLSSGCACNPELDPENGSPPNGENGNGETGNGENGNGETGNGETGNGETGNGETGNGETGNGETGNGETGNGDPLDPDACYEVVCPGTNAVEYCGSCVQDADGNWPWQNPNCLGPCDDDPTSFHHAIPGSGLGGCDRECFYDGDSGAGNDDCQWNHRCDPEEPRWNMSPSCGYNEGLVGTDSCPDEQSAMCLEVCLPMTPNGCDCFGCCQLTGADGVTFFGYIGSPEVDGERCSYERPDLCNSCTPVPGACYNECGRCQLCVGKTEVPDDCQGAQPDPDPDPGNGEPGEPDPDPCEDPDTWDPDYCQCEWSLQPCGLEGQDPCEAGYYCITGCCIEFG